MKASERFRLVKLYHHLYTRLYLDEGYHCFYCGDYASDLDHVPPLSLLEVYGVEQLKKAEIPFALIPSCSECNSMLSNRKLLDVISRLEYLDKRYNKAYDKRVVWTPKEIEEMGEFFQKALKARNIRDDELIRKIRAIEQRLVKPWTFPTVD